MKKKIIAAVLVSGLAVSSVAMAGWGRGAGNPGGCYCGQQGYYQQLDPAVQEKLDAFYNDTADLRKQLVMKQAERRALLNSTNPDPAAASKLAGEIFDLRTTLQQKAEAAGVDQYMGPGMMGGGRGMGPGMMGGRGMGPGGGRF